MVYTQVYKSARIPVVAGTSNNNKLINDVYIDKWKLVHNIGEEKV